MVSSVCKRFIDVHDSTGTQSSREVAEIARRYPNMTGEAAQQLDLFLSEFSLYEATGGQGNGRREVIVKYIDSVRGTYLFNELGKLGIPERLGKLGGGQEQIASFY